MFLKKEKDHIENLTIYGLLNIVISGNIDDGNSWIIDQIIILIPIIAMRLELCIVPRCSK